jgi:hypothetical protein
MIPEDQQIALELTVPEDLPPGPAELTVYIESGPKLRPEPAPRPSSFWQQAAVLRDATRGRTATPSEDLIREERDRDLRQRNR